MENFTERWFLKLRPFHFPNGTVTNVIVISTKAGSWSLILNPEATTLITNIQVILSSNVFVSFYSNQTLKRVYEGSEKFDILFHALSEKKENIAQSTIFVIYHLLSSRFHSNLPPIRHDFSTAFTSSPSPPSGSMPHSLLSVSVLKKEKLLLISWLVRWRRKAGLRFGC